MSMQNEHRRYIPSQYELKKRIRNRKHYIYYQLNEKTRAATASNVNIPSHTTP